MTDWAAAREEFPSLANWTYLNTATYGQVPRRGVEANLNHFRHRDETASSDYLAWYAEVDAMKDRIARLIHASHDDIAYIPNSSYALGLVAGGLDWKRGDNLITLADEFPNCLYLQALVERHGVEFREVPFERLYESIDERTRMVAFSEVNYATGFRPPLTEITNFLRPRGVVSFVDGTQSIGALQFDVQKSQPDVVAVHAYKWMISPTGTGFLYVAPEFRKKLPPNVAGWRTDRDWQDVDHLNHGMPVLKDSAERYEGGGLQFGLLHAMGAAVDWILELDPAAIESRVLDLARSARARLIRLGADAKDHGGQIVTAKFPGIDPSKLAVELKARRVMVAARHGSLRVSPHFYNNEADLDQFEDELKKLL